MAEPGVVYVVDDDESMRDLMEVSLRGAGFEVKTYASAEDLMSEGVLGGRNGHLKHAELRIPCCLLLDLEMPGTTGIEVLEWMKQQRTSDSAAAIPVIVITGRASVNQAVRSMKLGASDLFEKPFRTEDLVSRVNEAIETHRKKIDAASERGSVRERIGRLSPRERELLDAIVQGRSTKMIADLLGISARTVDHHRANLMQKMKADNVADLVRMAVQSDYTSVR